MPHQELRAAGHTEAFSFTQEQNVRTRFPSTPRRYVPDGTVRESGVDGKRVRELRLVKPL